MERIGRMLEQPYSREARAQSRLSSSESDLLVIGELITRLLNHYWAPTESKEVRQAQVEDWIEDLREFSAGAVRAACTEYRRRGGARRPTPGDIRKICQRDLAERNDKFSYAGLSEEQKREWHANVYAARRVFLGALDTEHTSPCDPRGQHFDRERVEELTAQKRRTVRDRETTALDLTSERLARFEAARAFREAQAKEYGFASFSDMLDYGLVRAFKRGPKPAATPLAERSYIVREQNPSGKPVEPPETPTTLE